MAFRRVILSGPKVKEVELDLKRFLDLSKTKIDFPGLKVDIKQGIKPDTLVVDINGDGADSFSKKVKDAGVKFQVQVVIKTEKPMDKKDLKEVIKKVLKEESEPKVADNTWEIKVRTWSDGESKRLSIKDLLQIIKWGLQSALNDIIDEDEISVSIEGHNLPNK